MKTRRPNISSGLYERYELKFVIPLETVEAISDFCEIYCRTDIHSEHSDTGFYTINSLYLDTPSYLFLHKRIDGCENRFNMRVRTYGENPFPCFLEIKQKRTDIVLKFRARVVDERWHQFMDDPGYDMNQGNTSDHESKTDLFYRLAYIHNVSPVVLTRYQRKAYESIIDDYARVTFDKNMKCQPAEGYELIPDENRLVPYDNSTIFEPGCDVVLELKCYSTRVPFWMIDMIRRFNLQRRSFSKYVFSVTEALTGLNRNSLWRRPSIIR